MDERKKLSSPAIFMRCLIIGTVLGLLFNQLTINYYAHKYLNACWFDRFYLPVAAFRMTKFFVINNDIYLSHILFIPICAGERIIYATFLAGFFVAIFIALFAFRAFAIKDLFSARYGTAKWEDLNKIIKSNKVELPDSELSFKKYKRYGLFIGTVEHKSGSRLTWIDDDMNKHILLLRELAHFGSQHIIVFAPTGSYKGVGQVLPLLVTYPSSVFVLDMSGENIIATSGYRHKEFGSIIIKYEPSCPDGSSARYNPLDAIRLGTVYEVEDAQKLATSLIDHDGEKRDHWKNKAWALMVGAILHILYTKENRTLNGLMLFLSGVHPDSKENYKNEKEWLSEMAGIMQNLWESILKKQKVS